jgi:hypothetical protein
MNEKFLATDPRESSGITKAPLAIGYGIPAAERQKNPAHSASRGSDRENEQAPEGRKSFTRELVPVMAGLAPFSPSSCEFSRKAAIGRGETISTPRALTYVPANTGSTVGFHPANFSPWNERELPCI